MKTTTKFLGLALIGTLVACGQRQIDDSGFSASSLDNEETSIESGVTALSALADDESGSSLAQGVRPDFNQAIAKVWQQLLPEAWAANCTRARFEACLADGSGGAYRLTNYAQCVLANNATLSGFVKLSYSDAACNIDVGDTVNRTYDVTFTGVYGGTLAISSARHEDYRGITIGGGGTLARISANEWQLNLAGKHKVLSSPRRKLFDVSVRTTAPLTLTGSLSRQGRIVDGGSYEVNHNLAQFTATYQPHQLTWTGTCCHPISGSLDVVYSGSVTGSAQVTFNGCGSATLVKDNLSRPLNLNYCE